MLTQQLMAQLPGLGRGLIQLSVDQKLRNVAAVQGDWELLAWLGSVSASASPSD